MRLTDSRLNTILKGYCPHTITVKQRAVTADNTGLEVESFTEDLADHVDLACRIGPYIESRATDREYENEERTVSRPTFTVKFPKRYPLIEKGMGLMWNQKLWDIVSVEDDGSSFTTRLRIERRES